MERSILKNIFSMFSIQGVNYLIPLITVPYLVRTLGLDGFGTYSIILAVIQYLVILTDYGFNLSASRQIALNVENKKRVSQIFCAIIFCKLIIAIISFLILLLVVLNTAQYKDNIWLFINGMGIVLGTSFFPVWLFQGYERMHWIAISNLIAKVLGLVLIFALVHNKDDIDLAIMVQSYTGLIAATFAFSKARLGGFIYFLIPTFSEIKEQLKQGWSIFLSTFFVSMYTTSIPLILGFNAGAEAVGIYNAADKLKQALQGIIGPVSQAIYPRSNRLIAESISRGVIFVKRISLFLCGFMVFGSTVSYFLAERIINLAFGVGHAESAEVLKVLVWIPSIVAVANMLGVQIMLPLGLSKSFGLTYVLIGSFGLPLMFIASYYGSYLGVAYAAVLIEVIITSIFCCVVIKKIKGKV
ncbi:flippase [Lelliottia aquatilis]|uniref:flippase n=1 Tax=Lelliottia aquatilis TaxID=2080838 RepID=UPI000CDE8A02|nr:flippase [Lelliottia aquatilis]POZ19609.1 flippase [Lelliottia aquatilis]